MAYVLASLPVRIGEIVLAYDMELRIYPMADTCFPDGHADDVFVRDIKDNWRILPCCEGKKILDEIARTDPATYEEIRLARISNAQGEAA